jgi:hypothetical protein
MAEITKATVFRTSAQLDETEWVEFKSQPRTTFVVTRAVLESSVGTDRWDFTVYGFRKEADDRLYGQLDHRQIRYSSATGRTYPPAELHDLFTQLHKA